MDIYPLKINSKNTECLGVNLQKEVKFLCNENLKSLKKEMKEDTGNEGPAMLMGIKSIL